jgi:hypothetical protein
VDIFRYKKKKVSNWDTLSSQRQKTSTKEPKNVDKKTDKSASSVNLDPRSDLSDEDEMIDVLGPIL